MRFLIDECTGRKLADLLKKEKVMTSSLSET